MKVEKEIQKLKVVERVARLTKTIVDAAVPIDMPDGTKRQRFYMDDALPGFGLVASAKTKSFFVQMRISGRWSRVTIGRYGVFTVEQARKEAIKILADTARGIDPVKEKRAARARGITLREAWELYKDTLKAKKAAPKTLTRYTQTVETYLTRWLDKPLADLNREDLRARHQAIAKEVAAGKYAKGRPRTESHGFNTANDAMRIFRAIWNRARRQHPELPECPTANVDFFKLEKPRTALSPESLRVWHKAVVADTNEIRRDLLLLLLFTGLRRGDGETSRWEHVDFKKRTMHLPHPKGGKEKAFDLPLSDYLLELLKQRQEGNKKDYPDSPFVFPAASESGHIREPRVEVPGVSWTPHDLRRTFITVAESLDISHFALKSLVNHSQPTGTTGGYISIDVERLRAPMQQITNRLTELCTAEEETP